MSANSKNARLTREARDWSTKRKSGSKGPKATTPKHGKKKAWHQIGTKRVVKQGEGGETIAFAIGTKAKS